jgi:hypothetical protein
MKIILTGLCFFLSALSFAQNRGFTYKDLKGLEGNWAGQLVYTDYSDDIKQVSLQASLSVIDMKDSLGMSFMYTEPNGKTVTDKYSMRIYGNGEKLVYDGMEFDISAVRRSGPRLVVIVEREGTDNNREADIRETFIIGPAVFNIQKEVRYEGSEKYFTRNKIQFTKK